MSEDKELDPGVVAALSTGRREPAPYKKRKKERDAKRDRLRLDVDTWLKDAVVDHAERQDMSWSQFAGFLIAYALYKWVAGDIEMHQLFAQAKTRVASLKWHYALVLDELRELIRRSRT